MSLSGGLTQKVHFGDLMLRGDAALAAELDHDHDEAAKLIAYTGAGQDPGVSLRVPPDVDPPACGEDIRPDDMAVVQFSLREDGHVTQRGADLCGARGRERGAVRARGGGLGVEARGREGDQAVFPAMLRGWNCAARRAPTG